MTLLLALPDRHPVACAALAALLVLASAYGFQFVGYPPCDLCWYQRYPYMAAVVLGILAFLVKRMGDRRLMWLFALFFLATATIAGFHVGVEEKWWDGPAACSGFANIGGSVEDALAALAAAPMVRCDEAAWRLFGISMAGYNFVIGLALALWSARAARKAT